ncbi:membrane-bound lytic murein transglycosylase A [Bradyrhizobium elkanii]|nr:MltA domain-containing protein [Bradyrhizobium elkanii]MCS3444961.1 membrane-bound lytic murein transglycosylase A [Bradyrhizobium elkanii]MCS3563911.1 membrane-bound lytic murein transglycosylase A [Bradyrhizobium elkanii]MCW2146257.1 membrane-bound lytic murein transglycosylase A [Bradyrhizobium elkanii]MCW2354670.1 membrane-bound lytic murein transglycosylase A [Bradyrhizobium elkanii]MCW2379084.1 membrane-bound lytic murein transglycosylase A [Bradyrhizobium elkanii]
MALEALTKHLSYGRLAVACCALAVLCSTAAIAARYRSSRHPPPRHEHSHPIPYPNLEMPLQVSGSQYEPLAWSNVAGWSADDHLAAYQAFRTSCKPIAAQQGAPADSKALGSSLRDPCRIAKGLALSDGVRAKDFFEQNFVPLRISRLGEDAGFVTGYYEPVLDGSRTQTDVYNVPVYRRPSNLFVRGKTQNSVGLPNGGAVYRKIGRRKLVPYYDRGQIEDGAIAGRGLEICWLKSQTDLLFAQIQGSARIKLEDGTTLRINYDAHNGYPYTPVGRVLIDRGIIPKDQMSMQKIREWMEQNPDGANDLRRQNRSYVFFREVPLSDKDEAVGAQGVPLTPGRSIAVDKALHVYGTPFFIAGELPIESEQSKTPFHRLMIAQDTGSAIVGPARADLYFGAGAEAGKVSGRLRHNMQFVMLVPRGLDPVARGHKLPVPDERPSAKIAKLFPQTEPPKDKPAAKAADAPTAGIARSAAKDSGTSAAKNPAAKDVAPAAPAATTPVAQAAPVAEPVPLPVARPDIPQPEKRRFRRYRHHRDQ